MFSVLGCHDPPIHEEEAKKKEVKDGEDATETEVDQDEEDTTDVKETVRTKGCAIANLDYRDKTKQSKQKQKEMCQGGKDVDGEIKYPWFKHCCSYIDNEPCKPYTGENPEPKGMIIYLLYLHVDINLKS